MDSIDSDLTGSGVIIVEKYRTFDNKIIPTILVGLNRSSNLLMDFGGSRSIKHKSINHTASAELLEETSNLVYIDPSILELQQHFDIPKSYRVYIIKAQGISSKYFDHNKKSISKLPKLRAFKEIKSIHHIPISNIDFETLLDRKSVYVEDVHHKKLKLHMRLRKALYYGKDLILKILDSKPIITKSNLITNYNISNIPNTYTFKT